MCEDDLFMTFNVMNDLVCELNLYVIKYGLYEDMFPMTFISNKDYESLKIAETNFFSRILNKKKKYWKFTENQLDNLIIKLNKFWPIFNITKINNFSFIIDNK